MLFNSYEFILVFLPISLLVDFSDINTITTEIIPSKDEVQRGMKWFWESLHFTAETGNLMLDRIFFYQRENCKLPEDFGVDIDSNNIQMYLTKRQTQFLENFSR